ncbi:hypothetical protein GWK47_005446 [Chionoecetes opilio]|uniref:Uncharacterized protein n=1 Tax=Chionoecetes opilio TaxID=41210 RepID=A0A8J5CJX0_CHIOP|nr:hypothetical protein GWK47_005446 [Chionoecetes opilio]
MSMPGQHLKPDSVLAALIQCVVPACRGHLAGGAHGPTPGQDGGLVQCVCGLMRHPVPSLTAAPRRLRLYLLSGGMLHDE